jgi:lipopolysaccharide export system ATP-binding protein
MPSAKDSSNSSSDAHAPGSSDFSGGKTRSLRAHELKKGYKGRQVVKGVTFEVRSGQVVGLLGPNGAGKTTSFYMVTGLVRADSGQVTLDDTDISTWPMHERAKKGIAYLPQEASVFRRMTVEENIMAVLETLPLSDTERRDRLRNLIDEFSIGGIARQKAFHAVRRREAARRSSARVGPESGIPFAR